jgi:Heterokaryon incompatibility protein (HET)
MNQADVQERNHQVQLMTAIYSSAMLVISWLCPPDEEIQSVLEFIPVMADEIAELDIKGSDGYSLDWMKKHPRLIRVGMDRGSDFECEFRARRIRVRGNFAHKLFSEIIHRRCTPMKVFARTLRARPQSHIRPSSS